VLLDGDIRGHATDRDRAEVLRIDPITPADTHERRDLNHPIHDPLQAKETTAGDPYGSSQENQTPYEAAEAQKNDQP
jgi:hypothetical protein